MAIPKVSLRWADTNNIETGHKIYRSDTPMSTDNMPTPIATIDENTERYDDENVTEGNFYYYRVSAYTPVGEEYSDEIYTEAKVPIGPGSSELIGGDMMHGFFGEVLSSEFITGDDLAASIGLTAGTSQYSDTPWLKYSLNEEIIYIPKKPIRYGMSWEHIYQAGAVYGTDDFGLFPSGGDRLQDARITIDEFEFKVTQLKGGNIDPVPNTTGYDVDWTHGSEWNMLMYPVHSGVHTSASNPSSPSEPYNQWASYSDEDLLVHNSFGNGTYCWTQEQHPYGATYRVYRGGLGVTFAHRTYATSTSTHNGFRPALRLVQ